LGGVAMSIQQFLPQGGGDYLIQIQLRNPPVGAPVFQAVWMSDQVSLAVWVDGSSDSPVPIPVIITRQ
jgi:hypothetical protein